MSDEDNKKRQINLLLEEWKQNVALYIDQDKRTFARIQMFLAINAALLIIFGYFDDPAVKILLAVIAIYITFITQRMYRRGHSYTVLRRVQGMLIEDKLKELMAGPDQEMRTSSGVVTTFSREHLIYLDRSKLEPKAKNKKLIEMWQSLRGEIDSPNWSYVADYFFRPKKPSFSHLKWHEYMFNGLHFLWGGLIVFVLAKNVFPFVLNYWSVVNEWLCEILF